MIRRRSATGVGSGVTRKTTYPAISSRYGDISARILQSNDYEGESMTASIVFASHVASNQRGSLESLVYFNSCQNRVVDSIVEAVERFGPLEIIQNGDRLRVRVSGLTEAQSLFAIEASSGRPIGVAVYVRPDLQHITVVHLGVAAEFASGGMRSSEQLLLRLVREVRRSSRRIKGVEHFELYYAARDRSTLNQQYAAYA